MFLDISLCLTPDATLFENLLLAKLQQRYGQQPAPRRIDTVGDARCFIIQGITETQLIAAHPASGEIALLSALQSLQQHQFPAKTRVILLSAEPPPALDWLSQHQALSWHRCQVLSINNDYGILIEDDENQLASVAPTQSPGRLQRETPPEEADTLPLTDEEQQFFSHL